MDVGNGPIELTYLEDKMQVYVANRNSNSVSIIDATGGTDSIVGNDDITSVDVGDAPAALTYLEDKMQVYVVNDQYSIDSVSIIDATGGTDGIVENDDVVSVDVGFNPIALTYLQDKMQVYVTNGDALFGSVSIIDATGGSDGIVNNDDVTSVDVGNFPQAITYLQDKMQVYVANNNNNSVSIIDATGGTDGIVENDDVTFVDVGGVPVALTYLEDKMQVYVVNKASNSVSIIDATGGTDGIVENDDVTFVDVGVMPVALTYLQDKMQVYVSQFRQ